MLNIDPIEAWTRTNFEGNEWKWLRESCETQDYDSFREGMFGASPFKWVKVLRFYVHCSTDLGFFVSDDQTPSGLRGIVSELCFFVRRLLMDEDLGWRIFEWLFHSRTIYSPEIMFNMNLPLELLRKFLLYYRMTFNDALFADYGLRFSQRFEMERYRIPNEQIPGIRGLLVMGPRLAVAMKDKDHSAVIDAIAACETWEEYEMMMAVASSSTIRMRTTRQRYANGLFGGRFSTFFHDAYHLCMSGRSPSEISHISPKNATLRMGADGKRRDLAGLLLEDGDMDMMTVQDFIDRFSERAWESLKIVIRDDVDVDTDDVAGFVSSISSNKDAAIGIGILFMLNDMFRTNRHLALTISIMKIRGEWEDWSDGLEEIDPMAFAEFSHHHYDLDFVRGMIERFGCPSDPDLGLGNILNQDEALASIINIEDTIDCYHGTSDHRYENGFPGKNLPGIREIGIVSPRILETEEFESRDSELDVVFSSVNPLVAKEYSFKSVGQDANFGISSKPIIIKMKVDVDSKIIDQLRGAFYNKSGSREISLAAFICGFKMDYERNTVENLVVTKEKFLPSSIIDIIRLSEDEIVAGNDLNDMSKIFKIDVDIKGTMSPVN